MDIVDSVIGEVAEKVTELGGHIVKQTGKAASDVAKGVITGGSKPSLSTQNDQEFIEGLYGKSSAKQSILSDRQKKKPTNVSIDPASQKRIAQIRQNLKALLTPPKAGKAEIPAYERAKPGGSEEEQKQQVDLIKKKKKELPPLPLSARQGIGTAEIKTGILG
jgi:hypothetical protein